MPKLDAHAMLYEASALALSKTPLENAKASKVSTTASAIYPYSTLLQLGTLSATQAILFASGPGSHDPTERHERVIIRNKASKQHTSPQTQPFPTAPSPLSGRLVKSFFFFSHRLFLNSEDRKTRKGESMWANHFFLPAVKSVLLMLFVKPPI